MIDVKPIRIPSEVIVTPLVENRGWAARCPHDDWSWVEMRVDVGDGTNDKELYDRVYTAGKEHTQEHRATYVAAVLDRAGRPFGTGAGIAEALKGAGLLIVPDPDTDDDGQVLFQ